VDSSVEILLASCNGEPYLAEQLRSIERQTFRDWTLLARDDGSRDSTREVLAAFRERFPKQVKIIEDGAGRLGAAGNFAQLLRRSSASYVFFCDQDDVWHETKIDRLIALAASAPAGRPVLVHSDLEVVDRRGAPIASSFWRYQRIAPERCAWQQLLVQNVVTGCAAMINAPLRDAALPIPAAAIMHDWWLALVAAIAGEIRWLPEPTVRYRQHGGNDTGAKKWGFNQWQYTMSALAGSANYQRGLMRARQQAVALANHPGLTLAPSVRSTLLEFGGLRARPWARRLSFVRRHGIAKNGAVRNLVFWRNL
jgi:glycosyltransferase involved in cell wall biosynthesis